jgi:signal transduction histidine kinase
VDARSPSVVPLPDLLDALGPAAALADPDGVTLHVAGGALAALGPLAPPWPPLEVLQQRAAERELPHVLSALAGGWRLLVLQDRAERIQGLRVALHDLRSPLANVRTYGSLIGRGKLGPEKLQQASQVILRNTDRALARVTDFVEAELALLGALGVELREAELRSLVEQAASTQEPAFQERGVRLELAPGEAVPTRADADPLVRALAAIMGRALARSPDGSVVRVEVRRAGSDAEVVVRAAGGPPSRDDGVGDLRARVARDRRLSPGTELYLAQFTVRAQGGRLELSAEPPGAAWRIRLPGG